jgi:DNA-directed RNA polymerase sigma subunit (sigma70/sigma32)
MSTFIWPAEDGWPYPDTGAEVIDLAAETDDDLMSLRMPSPHLFDDLDPTERRVVTAHFGLGGAGTRSMLELHGELGLSAAELESALSSALDKLRAHLIA